MVRLFLLLAVLFCIPAATTALAAQSTADTAVSGDRKQTFLKEILGDRVGQMPREEEYVIGHGDVLTVSIFEEGDMSASAVPVAGRQGETEDAPRTSGSGTKVMMDGRISLKNIGDVEVVGLTLTELAEYLKKLYASFYDDPIVTTTLVQSNSLRYTVMGEVAKPGIYFLDYPMMLVQVVARSGGFSQWANKKITVVRKQLKETDKAQFKDNTLTFDYDDFVSGKNLDRNVFLRSGDIVIVH